MTTIPNPQIELAFDYVSQTNKHIFLTGKAGTGKTTFLHRVRNEVFKRIAVVAPTGVAAINAEGVTIHSLFQLPFGPLPPDMAEKQINHARFNRQKIALIRSLDLLIIDEISMVRADVLDAIDIVLRRYRYSSQPFGGLQLLMIGDLHQLPPVVKPQEWDLLRPHYQTPYFFGSFALQKAEAVTIELKHIYRQADEAFIKILNKVRNNHIDDEVLTTLNSRYIPNFQPDESNDYITLTSHNAAAKRINREKLASLKGKSKIFTAKIDGDFPKHAYPTDEELELKVNAQVMFVKNDLSEEKRYYNGKIGRITQIKKNSIYVRCPGDEEDIIVSCTEWHNRKYSLNETNKEIEEKLIGSFEQYPLKLAWAITIHKSQGLTFERVIIDAQAAFAHGQVYVALSRCKTFEGIVLRSKLFNSSVKTDVVVKNYTEEAQQNEPGPEELMLARKTYQGDLLRNYFQFNLLHKRFNQFRRIVLENEKSLHGDLVQNVEKIVEKVSKKVLAVGKKFLPHLENYLLQDIMPEENKELIVRLSKAGSYFHEMLESLFKETEALEILSDNKEVRKRVKEKGEDLKKELFINTYSAKVLSKGFHRKSFAKVAADAELDFHKTKKSKSAKKKVPQNIEYPELYKQLTQWRRETAAAQEVLAYQILTTRSMLEIVSTLPTSIKNLKRVHGIGKSRAQKFGKEILEIVAQYTNTHQLETNLLKIPDKPQKEEKPDTKAISLAMYKSGKNLEEIAKERGFVVSTIENHLAYYVGLGQLDVHEFIDSEKVKEMAQYFLNAKSVNLSEAKAHFGEAYSYGQLRLARAHLQLDGKE